MDIPSSAARVWSAVLLAAALFLAGGALENFRPLPSGAIPVDTPLPVLETPAGESSEPPSVFRWQAGGADRDLAQVTVFRTNLEPFWSSAPTDSTEIRVDPADVFAGIPAGERLYWRVREVRDGRPRASSALSEFVFTHDVLGRPVGESFSAEPLLPSE